MGILRCLDSLMSLRSTRFQYNLQGGLFDLVVGLLILFNVGEDPVLLGLLISGYLITQALSLIILSFVISFRNPTSTRVAGVLVADSWLHGMDALALPFGMVHVDFLER
mgnify:CR=1 FL=1